MLRPRFLLPILLLLAACSPAPEPVIVAYANAPMDSLNANKLTHINYSFAKIEEGLLVEGRPEDAERMAAMQQVRRYNPDIKILISVGGWSWSDYFSDAALTPESRERFARSAIEFVKRHRLDGVDLDWEYPGQKGEDNVFRPEDKQNFTLLLAELRRQLDALTQADGRKDNPYLLTIASASGQTYLDHTEMDKVQLYLDFVNIMTYDFTGPWTQVAGHHTNLGPSPHAQASGTYAIKGVDDHIAAGVPAAKIVLGTAFYGRWWSEVDSAQNGLYQPYTGESGAHAYHTLAAEYIDKNGFVRHWDKLAQAPYLWNDSLRIHISYDDPQSLAAKARYVREKGLRGVMFWHFRHDSTGVLLESLYRNLH